ncbi:MAG: NAD-dependent epimerase/dehydratase family protein [Marinilabiliaceae bacterium]|nr:NAD-dependent epimerase/dehydratase family protein [Marinilabiliaceae bacterium]
MKTVVIAGSTGLIGNLLLKLLIENSDYSKLICIGRSEPKLKSDKSIFIKSNYTDLNTIKLPTPIDELYCCLGTTIKKAGNKNNFRMVDYDSVIELGKWAQQFPMCRFVVISSVGANPKSSNFYLRTKGQMENTLKQLKLHSLIILRPSLLLGHRNEFRFSEQIAQIIMPAFSALLIGKYKKYAPIKAISVANAMVAYAQSKFGDTYIIESDMIQNF